MVSYPNQKLYHIKKKIEEGDIFIMLKWEDYTSAARELSPSALNLYMYLAKNQDDYNFYFSSADYCSTFQVVDKTFRNARKELMNKGYLKEGEKNHVYFDSKGGFKETKESLQEEFKEIASKLKVESETLYSDLKKLTQEKDLPNIEDETLYKIEIRRLISIGSDYLKDCAAAELKKLL